MSHMNKKVYIHVLPRSLLVQILSISRTLTLDCTSTTKVCVCLSSFIKVPTKHSKLEVQKLLDKCCNEWSWQGRLLEKQSVKRGRGVGLVFVIELIQWSKIWTQIICVFWVSMSQKHQQNNNWKEKLEIKLKILRKY